MGFVVGDGKDVSCWLDAWVGVGPLCSLVPRLFRLTVKKESSVSECFEVGSGCMVWGVSFRKNLRPLEGDRYEELFNIIGNAFFWRDSKDSRI